MDNNDNNNTVKPFLGEFPKPSSEVKAVITEENVMSPDPIISSEPATEHLKETAEGNVASAHLKKQNDIAMSDINNSMSSLSISKKNQSMMSIDEPAKEPVKRRSTLILTDEADNESSSVKSGTSTKVSSQMNAASSGPVKPVLYPVEIQWIQGGNKVYVTGSFTGWTKMIKMKSLPGSDKSFVLRLNLPVGTHRFRFVVDNELRFSDYLPTATDSRGNFVNYIEIFSPDSIEVPNEPITGNMSDTELRKYQEKQKLMQEGLTPEQKAKLSSRSKTSVNKDSRLGLTLDDDDMGGGYSRFHEKSMLNNAKEIAAKKDRSYTSTIPSIFVDPQAMERYYLTVDQQTRGSSSNQWLTPPSLPPHLDHVILNNQQQHSTEAGNFNKELNAGGSLPIPNHVILNHLATTSIKHNTLAVATTVRYKRKYLTQILYAPL